MVALRNGDMERSNHRTFTPAKALGILTGLAVVLFLGFANWVHYCGDSTSINLPVCTLSAPDGWITEKVADFDGVKEYSLLFFEGPMRTPGSTYSRECSSGCLAYKESGFDLQSMMLSRGVQFLRRHEATESIRNVNGKKIYVLRYEGPYYQAETEGVVEEKKGERNIVTAHFFTDDGFWGTYAGFPEEEAAFWSMIDSIKWVNQPAGW